MKLFIMLCVFLLSSVSVVANETHGTLAVVKGDVQVESAKTKSAVKAKIGTKVFPGDTIITKKDARAKLVMIDKNIINISPDSKFAIEKYEYNPAENKKGALINVIYGKIRTTVNQKYDAEKNKFQVKTKSSVAGVRGTDFMVSFNDTTKASKIVTFEGKVEVGQGFDTAGRIINPVSVTPGQFTVVAVNQPPTLPMAMPAAELNSLNQQSVADSPMNEPGKGPGGEPGGQDPNGNERSPSGEKKEGPMPPRPGSVLNEMGEDVAAPVASDNGGMRPPTDIIPRDPTSQPQCPGGQCGMPGQVDPNLINGKTNVLINLQPQ